ncbi:MAG: homoserine dehydrogenase [Alphaproteobacteria bacterium]|nr:homoserine dehydrogenase [Alphaproteobacteria bacterium]
MEKPLRIAIAGLGIVGSAVFRILERNEQLITPRAGRKLQVVAISDQERNKHLDKIKNGIVWLDDARDMASMPDVDVIAVLIGGETGIALEVSEKALNAGKSVVTSNKALMAAHGTKLASIAEKKNAQLMFEASVAGGIPILKTLREAITGNRNISIQGILNGTCNYILTRMTETGLSFSDALKEAQEKGYAESDPSMDIDGHDTAHKLSLLAALAFGETPSLKNCPIEGIRRISALDMQFAEELGYKIKLLGTAHLTDQGLEKRVGPCLVPKSSTLANTNDVLNAISVQCDALGTLTLTGRGAGGEPTASAVISDLIDIARGNPAKPFGIPASALKNISPTPPEKRMSGWYIRMQVADKPGVLADVSAILRDENISIESMLQRARSQSDSVPIIMKTHITNEAAMRKALTKIAALIFVKEEPYALRVE